VDIRPAEAFQDYALPLARQAELADVLTNPGYLTGVGPLIIVDRDGSLANILQDSLLCRRESKFWFIFSSSSLPESPPAVPPMVFRGKRGTGGLLR